MSRASPCFSLGLAALLLLAVSPSFFDVAWADWVPVSDDPVIVVEGGSSSDEGDPDELDGTDICVDIRLKMPPTTTGGEAPGAPGSKCAAAAGWLRELSVLIRLFSVIP